jgi:hypothetical protein
MYLIDFVNHVRQAQSYEGLAQLPPPGADGSTPLELAMGCRLERGVMRLSSPQAAAAVADATGLPVGSDRGTISLPDALEQHAAAVAAARDADEHPRRGAGDGIGAR